MFKAIKLAYGRGYRAGRANPVLLSRRDGISYVLIPPNPFLFSRNPLLNIAWANGEFKGVVTRLKAGSVTVWAAGC